MAFKWDDYDEAKPFNWDQHEVVGHDSLIPQHSALATGVMHGLQGATGGLMDEIQGAGEAAGRLVGVKGAGGPMKDMGLAEGGPTHDWAILKDAYQRARDHERQTLAEQEKQHPDIAGAANLAGAVVSPINKLTKGMSLAKAGAVMGGINSFGKSEKEDLPGLVGDTTIGAGTGALIGQGLSKLGSGAQNVIEDAATTPLAQSAPAAPSIVGKAMQGAQAIGAKGNDLLDKITPDGVGKFGRYMVGGKIQGGLDTLQHGPQIAQNIAGKASAGIDGVKDFLMRSPRFQSMAENTPKAFSSLASSVSGRVSGPNQQPVSEEQAKQDFLKGN